MSSEVKSWFSAGEISLLGEQFVASLPTTMRGSTQKAQREGWVSREVKGFGGKGGIRTEYQPPANVLALIHAFLQANPNFFEDKRKARRAEVSAMSEFEAGLSGSLAEKLFLGDDGSVTGDDRSVTIDHYVDVRGSAGPGAEPHEETIIKVRVDAQLLRERVGSNFNRIKIAAVSGDSMEPTLSHGDQVLVDTSCTRFIDNAIYAIQQDGHLRFKRITLKLDGSIIVKSDASPGEVETYTAEDAARFFVIGEVIPFKFGRFKV